jgi:hypothetical protein
MDADCIAHSLMRHNKNAFAQIGFRGARAVVSAPHEIVGAISPIAETRRELIVISAAVFITRRLEEAVRGDWRLT